MIFPVEVYRFSKPAFELESAVLGNLHHGLVLGSSGQLDLVHVKLVEGLDDEESGRFRPETFSSELFLRDYYTNLGGCVCRGRPSNRSPAYRFASLLFDDDVHASGVIFAFQILFEVFLDGVHCGDVVRLLTCPRHDLFIVQPLVHKIEVFAFQSTKGY